MTDDVHRFPALSSPGDLVPAGPLSRVVQSTIARVTGRGLTTHNRVQLLHDGPEAFAAMLRLVETAREEVLFENFIFRDDPIGDRFADALRARADQGVHVWVLYDAIGSLFALRRPIGLRFRGSRATVQAYNVPWPHRFLFTLARDHRKVVVQDRRRLVTGGVCISAAWMPNPTSHLEWRDAAILIDGDAGADVAWEFARLWKLSSRRSQPFSLGQGLGISSPAGRAAGAIPVRVIADEPRHRRVERVLAEIFEAARASIFITNPYFVPTAVLRERLVSAARRGVDVRVLIPLVNNHPIVGLSAEHHLGPLLDAGVAVFRWSGPMLHAKTVVVDGCWSLIGSSNLDPLSLRGNGELNVEIHGTALGSQMVAAFEDDCARSSVLTPALWHSRSLGRRWVTAAAAGLTPLQ